MDWSIIIDGLFTALEPMNMVWLIFGALLGTIVGILPGLGPATGVAVLIPLTFGMNPVSALILMSAIYYGALFGGSRSSILINTPGDGSSIAATFDGYPMTLKAKLDRPCQLQRWHLYSVELWQSSDLFFLLFLLRNLR